MARITLVPPDVPVSEAGTMVRDGVRGEAQAGATGETNIVVRETMAPMRGAHRGAVMLRRITLPRITAAGIMAEGIMVADITAADMEVGDERTVPTT